MKERREKEEERKRDRIWRGSWSRVEVPHLEKPPHWQANQLGKKGSIWGCQRRVKWLVCGRQERVRPTQTVRATALNAPDWDTSMPVHTRAENWNVGIGANPGRRLLFAVRRQPEGTGGRKSATENACGGNPDCHRSKAPLLRDAQGVEPPLKPLSPHVPGPCPARRYKSPPWLTFSC